jgi:hypothetical protein
MSTSKKANNIIHGTHIRLLYATFFLWVRISGGGKKSI